MATEWYYTINGQQAPEPTTAAQLKQMALSGQLQPTDLVWQEGLADWVPASSIKGLFSGAGSRSEAMSSSSAPLVESPLASKARGRVRKSDEAQAEDLQVPPSGMLALHPLLVWLLSICTLGLFGLVFAYLVCKHYGDQSPLREFDATGRPLGKVRHPLGILVLSYLTLGIYLCIWAYRVMLECYLYLGRNEFLPRTELALMFVFPPYAVYIIAFRLPGLIRAVQQHAKRTDSASLPTPYLFLHPCVLPALPLLCMLQQESLNQVWLQVP